MTDHSGRVQRRQRETKERIFRVAMELFGRQGFEQTTIAEIAEAADIGKGTFFTYFPTKEAIFGHLGAVMTDSMAEALEAGLASDVPVAQVLERLFVGAAAWHEVNRPLTGQVIMAGIRMSFAMEADLPNQQRMLELLTGAIRVGQERGEFRTDVPPGEAATVMVGLYFTTLLAWVSQPEPGPVSERLRTALGLLVQGLRV